MTYFLASLWRLDYDCETSLQCQYIADSFEDFQGSCSLAFLAITCHDFPYNCSSKFFFYCKSVLPLPSCTMLATYSYMYLVQPPNVEGTSILRSDFSCFFFLVYFSLRVTHMLSSGEHKDTSEQSKFFPLSFLYLFIGAAFAGFYINIMLCSLSVSSI